MHIGALQKFSLIDYPGKICAIIFTQGCNFRCPYCHNPELVLPELYTPCVTESDILQFLQKRSGKLNAVSITGGEPTLQTGLDEFIREVKRLGYAVKLDTNGSRPAVLQHLIQQGLLDYIAMDIKAPPEKYAAVTASKVIWEDLEQSIQLIRRSRIEHEFRTTMIRSLLDESDLFELAKLLSGDAIEHECFIVQKFVPNKMIDPSLADKLNYTDQDYARMKDMLERILPTVAVR